jgi:tetratricopeptide (TPR) repeat protein
LVAVAATLILFAGLAIAADIPTDPRAWDQKARSLCGGHLAPPDRKVKELREFCQGTLESNPSDQVRALAERWLGEAYTWKEDNPEFPADADKAIAQFNRVIELFPESDQAAWARYGIAEVYRVHEKKKEAVEAYADLMRTGAPDALLPWIAYRWANLAEARKETTETRIQGYRDVVTQYPGSQPAARALMYVAHNLLSIGRTAEAATEFERLISEYGKIAERVEVAKAHDRLAKIAQKSGDEAGANEHWTAIIEQFPDTRMTFDAFYYISRSYVQGGPPAGGQEAIAFLEPHARSGPAKKQAAALLVLERLYREAGLEEKAAAARERLRSGFLSSHDVYDLAYEIKNAGAEYYRGSTDPEKTIEAAKIIGSALLLNLDAAQESSARKQAALASSVGGLPLALSYAAKGDIAGAARELEKVVRESPDPALADKAQHELSKLAQAHPEIGQVDILPAKFRTLWTQSVRAVPLLGEQVTQKATILGNWTFRITSAACEAPWARVAVGGRKVGNEWTSCDVDVTIGPMPATGSYESTLVVQTNDSAQPRLEVPIHVGSLEPIRVGTPGGFYIESVKRGEMATATVKITSWRPFDLTFLKVEYLDGVAVDLTKVDEKSYVATARFTAVTDRRELTGTVHFETNLDAQPVLYVPFLARIEQPGS